MSGIPLVAGVDSSTQSTKVELRHLDTGKVFARASSPHPAVTPPVSEQHPDAWWSALVTAFRDAREQVPGGRVRAVSIAAQCHGLVALDERDEVIRPAKLWNDTTSTAALRALRERIGTDTLIDRVGTLPTAAFTIGKIAWLAQHEPENFRRMRRILLPHDYLTFRLTGQYVTDRSEASGTGYYDADRGEYLPDFLRHIDADMPWESMLPRVGAPADVAGTVTPAAAAALGLDVDIVVGVGGGDQHAAALGLGMTPGDVVYSIGTSGVVLTLSPHAVRDTSGWVDGVADMTDGFLPLVSTLNAAKVTDTFARILGVSHDELSRLALAASPDRPGPVLAPFFEGERTPDLPDAVGLLARLTTDTTREEVARAAYEGVLLGLVRGQSAIERMGVDTSGDVMVVGGGARSAATSQLLADLLGRDVQTADVPEATATGAAIQAAAVARGTDIVAQRDAWAPARRLLASPRDGARDPRPVYERVAAVRSLDRP
ncbi:MULTISPECIES: xylulokinase [Actinomycetes]|uniref:xylulokinase n=1 Tax=Actinomycetes TaxID=1760 RepID=UPI0019D20EA4|nr:MULTISPECIES: xylulokinase [Actinomycetes]